MDICCSLTVEVLPCIIVGTKTKFEYNIELMHVLSPEHETVLRNYLNVQNCH